MSANDIVEIPGYPGSYTRRFVVDMWTRAGRPPINSAGRLYAAQKEAWNKFQNGTGSPADDPDRPWLFRLPHVRFIALDVPPAYAAQMERAGFYRPLSYEPWHFEAARDYTQYPLITSIPEEDEMALSNEDVQRVAVATKKAILEAVVGAGNETSDKGKVKDLLGLMSARAGKAAKRAQMILDQMEKDAA
jgi:hypothetical protein